MGAYHRTYDIMGIHRVVDPVPEGFIGSIFQGLAAAGGRNYGGPEHFHPGYIGCLALHIYFAHIYDTFQPSEPTNRRGTNSILTGPRFGNAPFFSQVFGQTYLP